MPGAFSIGHPVTVLNATFASSGDNTIITGVAKQTIFIWGVDFAGATATAVTLKDGASTTLYGPPGTVTVFTRDMLPTGYPRWKLTEGNSFIINLGAANSFSGQIFYSIVSTTLP